MPGSKTSSKVTRTTRVIYVQEISDTFEAETVDTSSFEPPTSGASTSHQGTPRATTSDPSHPEGSLRENYVEEKSGKPRSRKAEGGEPEGGMVEAGSALKSGFPVDPVLMDPDNPLKTGSSLRENNGLILTARLLEDGLKVVREIPPVQGGINQCQTRGTTTFASNALLQKASEIVSYTQDSATGKATHLQHGNTIFCPNTFPQEDGKDNTIVSLVPSLKDGGKNPITPPQAGGTTGFSTPPVTDCKVVLQVESDDKEPHDKPANIRPGKNRVHPFVEAGRGAEKGGKKVISPWPNPTERSSRAPKALQEHNNDLRTLSDSLTYAKFYPVILSMKATGLFFVPRKVVQGGCFPLSILRNVTCQQAYCLSVIVCLFINFVRSLFAFGADSNANSNTLFFKLMVSIFFYESFSRAALAYMSCRRDTKGLRGLFLHIDRVCFADRIVPYESSLRRWIRFFLALSVFLSIANVVVTAFGMFGPADIQDLFDVYVTPMTKDSPGAIGFKVVFLVMTALNSAVATMSLTFYAITCHLLFKEFEYLCRTLSLKINADGQLTDDLEKFRMMHQKRCQLVEEVDELFKYYVANTYLCNVPLLCLLFYGAVYATSDSVSYRFISIFRCTYVLAQVMIMTVTATMINTKAHAPLTDIYNIKVQQTGSRQLEVNMFLSKLTGTSIGLTALDMFVLNKPALLTIIGVIITYFLLLVQLQSPVAMVTECYCHYALANGSMVNLTGKVT